MLSEKELQTTLSKLESEYDTWREANPKVDPCQNTYANTLWQAKSSIQALIFCLPVKK